MDDMDREIGFSNTSEDDLSDKEFNDIIGADFDENSNDVNQTEEAVAEVVEEPKPQKKFSKKPVKQGSGIGDQGSDVQEPDQSYDRQQAENDAVEREIEDYETINGEKPSPETVDEIRERVHNLSDEELSLETDYQPTERETFENYETLNNETVFTEKTDKTENISEDFSEEFGYQSNFDVKTKEETVETVHAEETQDEGVFSNDMTFVRQEEFAESHKNVEESYTESSVNDYKEENISEQIENNTFNTYTEETSIKEPETGTVEDYTPEESINTYKEDIISEKVENSDFASEEPITVNDYREDRTEENIPESYAYKEESAERPYESTTYRDEYSDTIAGETHTFNEHSVEYGRELQDAANPFVARQDGVEEPTFYDVPKAFADEIRGESSGTASDTTVSSETSDITYERVSEADIDRFYQEQNFRQAEKTENSFDTDTRPVYENNAPSQTYVDGLNDHIRQESNIINQTDKAPEIDSNNTLKTFYTDHPEVMQAHNPVDTPTHTHTDIPHGKSGLSDGEHEEKAVKSDEDVDLHNKREQVPVKEDIGISKTERREGEGKVREFKIKDEKGRERVEEKAANVGKSSLRFVENVVTSGSEEDHTFSAKNKLENYAYIIGVSPTEAIGELGAVGSMKLARSQSNAMNIAAEKADKAINSGIILPTDLKKSPAELTEMLKKGGFNTFDANQIAKYKDKINNSFVTKTELQKAVEDGKISLSEADKKAASKLFEKDFSDYYKNGKAVNTLTNKYFSNHPDELLKKVGSSNDIKGLKNYLKKADETDALLKKGIISEKNLNGRIYLSKQDRMMLENKILSLKAQKDKAAGKAVSGLRGGINKIKRPFGIFKRALLQQSDVALSGAKKIAPYISAGTAGLKGAAKILKKTGQLWWRKSQGARAVRYVGKQVGKAIKRGVKTVKTAVVKTKPMQAVITAKNKGIDKIKLAKKAFDKTKGGKAVKAVGKGLKKAGHGAKKVFGFTNRVGQVIFAPLNFFNKAIGAIKRFLRKILFKLLIIIGIILIPIIAIALLAMFATTVINGFNNSIGAIGGESVALPEENAHASIEGLTDIARTTKEEAVYVSKRTPTEKGSNGITLYQYGNPESITDPNKDIYHNDVGGETTNGIDLVFYDSNKNPVGSNTNNIKDAMSIAAVMLGNDFNTQESVDNYTALSSEIMRVLNPACTFKVSDIYHMPQGYSSDKFPYSGEPKNGTLYYCTDDDFYSNYNTAVSNGVVFFQSPHPHTERGCRINTAAYESAYKSYIAACQAVSKANANLPEGGTPISYPDPPDINDYYYCPGHPYLDCDFGYRKIKVFSIILTKDDVYKAFRNSSDPTKAEIHYFEPLNYECTEWEEKTVTLDVSAYADHIKDFVANKGYLNQETIDDSVFSSVSNASTEAKMISYLDGTTYWTNKQIEWTQEIYNGDWVANYGVDPATQDLGGAGLATGSVMTPEQIKSITAQISYDGGVIGEKQKAMVEWGLSKVGGVYSQDLSLRMSGLDGHIYDCSSFAYWACQKVGITLGADYAAGEAQWLQSEGCQVTDGMLKPGDLIYYSYTTNGRFMDISHVSIYIGNNQIVHASSPSVGIITSEYSSGGVVMICRPLKLLNL